ncbi:complement component C1q receptor-like [Leucoraja erinacea]|uniref:complement component C1q receptor-like n=1 Tax=Leucoraja erinaceus TaxID=7782 RepID=UPI002454D268|nr:complement component C1q receptor-like [Leucoraja erinacea]
MLLLLLLLLMLGSLSAVTGNLPLPSHTLCVADACYTAYLHRKTFHPASESCKYNGGKLATVGDAGEDELIHRLLSGFPAGRRAKSRFWLGLHLPPRHCYQHHRPLRGFQWTAGGGETAYSNWAREPLSTCTAHRCVHLVNSSSPGGANYKWMDGSCSHAMDGYLCKFSFRGMCPRVELGGPGSVTYTPPFRAEILSSPLIPFGSLAVVSCAVGSPAQVYMLCVELEPQSYGWSKNGSFCLPASGCDLDNGGCAQICVSGEGGDGGGGGAGGDSHRCQCKAGYQLEADQRSCEPRDPCKGHQCQFQCVGHLLEYQCVCPSGYRLAGDGRNCVDLDECAGRPCHHTCLNTDGSYRCQCRAGYRLQAGARSCADIDECASSPCHGTCSNTMGSFECSCSPGSKLGQDGVSCLPTDRATTPHISATTVGDRSPTTLAPLVLHAVDSATPRPGTSSAQPEETRGRLRLSSLAAETRGPGLSAVTSPSWDGDQIQDRSPGLSWFLRGALVSVAVLLLVLCAVGFTLCLRHRLLKKKESNAGDYYSWVEAAGQSKFRAPYVKCSRSRDNYIEIEASQTEV